MKTWTIEIETVLHTETQVCATTREEAEEIVKSLWENKECLPDMGDSIGTDIISVTQVNDHEDSVLYGDEYEATVD